MRQLASRSEDGPEASVLPSGDGLGEEHLAFDLQEAKGCLHGLGHFYPHFPQLCSNLEWLFSLR